MLPSLMLLIETNRSWGPGSPVPKLQLAAPIQSQTVQQGEHRGMSAGMAQSDIVPRMLHLLALSRASCPFETSYCPGLGTHCSCVCRCNNKMVTGNVNAQRHKQVCNHDAMNAHGLQLAELVSGLFPEEYSQRAAELQQQQGSETASDTGDAPGSRASDPASGVPVTQGDGGRGSASGVASGVEGEGEGEGGQPGSNGDAGAREGSSGTAGTSGGNRRRLANSKLPGIEALLDNASTNQEMWKMLLDEMKKHQDTAYTWYGVGCDDCGVFPIQGRRYRCQDCPEAIGYDLCGACQARGPTGVGRFNQQHRPGHRMIKVEPDLDFSRPGDGKVCTALHPKPVKMPSIAICHTNFYG